MPAEARRRHLLTAMADAGIEHVVLYGNAWQGDYLRYAADFGILEGHGIALVSSSLPRRFASCRIGSQTKAAASCSRM